MDWCAKKYRSLCSCVVSRLECLMISSTSPGAVYHLKAGRELGTVGGELRFSEVAEYSEFLTACNANRRRKRYLSFIR